MNISSHLTRLAETHDPNSSARRRPGHAAKANRLLKPFRKPDICFVATLLVLSICAPLRAAYAQECEPGALDYIVRDGKGKIFNAQALESIRKGMQNPAQEVGTVSVGKDGETYRSYQSARYNAGRKIPALSYVDVAYVCRIKVPEATLIYRGKTMRLLFNVDIPNEALPIHTLVIDSLPFQEGTFKLDLSRKRDGEFGKVLSARRWKKVSGKPIPRTVQSAPTPVDLTSATDSALQQHLGERVTMRGQFSLRGKVGPFILVGGRPIYLVPKGTFSWGKPYASMEGQDVRVTGTLRFAHYPVTPSEPLPVGRPSDHFYFEAETAKVELSQR